SAAAAIALGTYVGGWRIIRTMGSRIIKMDPAQGFTAQGAGAAVILASSHFGYPLSTTQVISGGVMGAGAARRLSAVRWGVAGNIAGAWVLTLPASAAIGAIVYGVTRIFGTGELGGGALRRRGRGRTRRLHGGDRAGPRRDDPEGLAARDGVASAAATRARNNIDEDDGLHERRSGRARDRS